MAYAVAEQLGFSKDQVKWIKVPFNTSYAPGAKDFDFDINQISITPERAEVVDFSDGYYSAAQAVIALKGTDGRRGDQPRRPQGPAARRPDRHHLAHRDPRRHQAGHGPGRLRGHQRRQAGAAERPGRRDPRRPADRLLHLRGGDPEERDRRAVPAGDRRAGGVRHALREGQRAGPVRQRGAGRAARGRHARRRSSSSGSPTSWTFPSSSERRGHRASTSSTAGGSVAGCSTPVGC